jgi:NADP-dependent 3-hydroxy acid dehydrogenase YdfG
MSRGTAVVTGASSGIGAATARRLVVEGYDVIAAARRADRLTALADEIGCGAVVLDVTDEASVRELADALDVCHVLVNNAGGAFGLAPVEDADDSDWQRMWDVNVMGMMRMTRALLPQLEKSGDGVVVNLTSTAGHVAYEGGGGYAAVKHAAVAVTRTLRLELLGRPIRVVEIAPGMVATEEFTVNRLKGDAAKAAATYAGVPGPLSAEDIADCIAWAATRPWNVNIDQIVVRPRAQAAQHRLQREDPA